eukprot:TRINITY_DN7234_c0_g1_i1.p1 TRINITY_DN7234_c0_g1~~TRINITY_DN7234_c0_g1_i1.p1  ORF type:complete len:174 (+),score=51.49 TRINITY_DN7234_c0_g1_i1:60-581(+)
MEESKQLDKTDSAIGSIKVICLGSESKIKLDALRSVFPEASVRSVRAFVSGVAEQPIGKPVTYDGAKYRAVAASKEDPSADLWAGIENGMYRNDQDVMVDAACIVLLLKTENGMTEEVLWSDELVIPPNMKKGRNGEWSYLKDPHIVVTNGKRSREQFIADRLRQWKEERNKS